MVGKNWEPNKNKERDNRGKCYRYFSPNDRTVGLINVQEIDYWGVHYDLLQRLGPRFYQRVFARRDGSSKAMPPVASPVQGVTLKFELRKESGYVSFWRARLINGEELPQPFLPWMRPAQLPINSLDAAIAVTNTYQQPGKEGMRPGLTQLVRIRRLAKSPRSSLCTYALHPQALDAFPDRSI